MDGQEGQESPEADPKPLMIIGKEHCFETTRELPIGRINEAVKAARMMDDVAPFKGRRYFLVESLSDSRTLVTFCTVKQDVYQKLYTDAWLLLPEPLLIKLQMSKEAFSEHSQLTFSIGSRKLSVIRQGLNFRCQLGGNVADETLTGKDYTDFLINSLSRLPSHLALQAINQERITGIAKSIPWKRCGIASALVFTLYLAMTSLWLGGYEQHLQEKITAQRSELDTVFALQRQLEQYDEKIASWRSEPTIAKSLSGIWPVVLDLIDQNVEILSFTLDEEGIVIRGRADKATDAIAFLAERPEITLPESISPVAKSQRREIFAVRFQLEQELPQ